MIEDFSRVLAQAMGLKNMNKNSEALEEIHEAYKTFFGLDYSEMEKMAPLDFVKKVALNIEFKKEHLESIARGLMMEGDLFDADPVKAFDCRKKALMILIHLEVEDAGTFSIWRKEAIKELRSLL